MRSVRVARMPIATRYPWSDLPLRHAANMRSAARWTRNLTCFAERLQMARAVPLLLTEILRHRTMRPIRSYVLRQGRLTAAQGRAHAELLPRFGIRYAPQVTDLDGVFG